MARSHRAHARSRSLKPLWWTTGILFFFLLMAGIAYSADLMMNQGKVPRGVSVGGVDIGGMSTNGAEKVLRDAFGDNTRSAVLIKGGTKESRLDPTLSGLKVNWTATVAAAGRQPKNPITRLTSLWQHREVGIVSDIDYPKLDTALRRVQRELAADPTNAALAIGEDGKAQVTDGIDGQQADLNTLTRTVETNWLNTQGVVTVAVKTIEPDVGDAAVTAAQRDILNKVVSGPVTFKGRNNVNGVIPTTAMGKIVTFRIDGDHFVADYNTQAAQGLIETALAASEIKPKNAAITVNPDGGVTVTSPSQDGTVIEWEKTLANLDQKLLNTQNRNYDVVYEEKKAAFTTEMAQNARFNEVMGEFSTGGFAAASGVNIRRVAQMVNGAIVGPGETFSLNGYTGPRGEAQGFVKAGVILNGHADSAVGGGISQFATTLYNASYFAGMEDVYHQPHSYYISRYPAGREATVYEGAIDLKFKNPFDVPVMIVASADSSTVSVRLMGVKQVTVKSVTGEKTNFTQPQEMRLTGATCAASAGAQGFTVTDTRIVSNLAGQEVSRKTTTTKYDPAPKVVCE